MEPIRAAPSTHIVIGGVVVIIAFLLAAATAIYIARPDQAGVIVTLLIGLVAPTIVGLMALARSDRSVDVAHQARDTAAHTSDQINQVSSQVNGRMSEILRLLNTTATTQVGKDVAAQIVIEAALAGLTTSERRAVEDAQIIHSAADLQATRDHQDAVPPTPPPAKDAP